MNSVGKRAVEPFGRLDDRPGLGVEDPPPAIDHPLLIAERKVDAAKIGLGFHTRALTGCRRWTNRRSTTDLGPGGGTTFEQAERISEGHGERPARGPTATPSGRSPGSLAPEGGGRIGHVGKPRNAVFAGSVALEDP